MPAVKSPIDVAVLLAEIEASGLPHRAFAERAGIGPRTLSKVLADKVATYHVRHALADACGRHPDELVPARESAQNLPAGIARHLISFDSVLEDRGRGFVGRDFLFDQIDAFLTASGRDSGILLLRGAPGIGKSAFMSELIRRRKLDVYHFNIALLRINKRRDFIGNICARLIARYDLPWDRLPDDFDQDGRFLTKILEQASAARDDDTPVIIAIDALDEVDASPGGPNPLLLPLALPRGVYLVVTARHQTDLGLHGQVKEVVLDSADSRNMADIHAYVKRQPRGKQTAAWMRQRGLSEQAFVDLLAQKSEGNFMYIRHVLPEIEQGGFTDDSVDEMPLGLRSYYRFHWQQMQAKLPKFDDVYRPVVCCLAAVQAPVDLATLMNTTGLERRQVRYAIDRWREFLHGEVSDAGERLYRVYHLAFREFLEAEVDPGLVTYHRLLADAGMRELRALAEDDG